MFASRRGRIAAGVLAAGALLALSACSSGNALDSGSTSSSSAGTITVGSAAFGESQIIAEIYAQALEAKGVKVNRNLSIGQRDVYLAALKDGSIDLIPEYSGNLLQFYDKTATAQSSDDVYSALQKALPAGFEVLNQSQAQDADSYNVTKAFSDKYNVKSLADLAAVKVPLTVAANPEFATRPYGIPGLKSQYGVTAALKPINDSGGPATVTALKNGSVQLADIYTTTPAIKDNNFVTLEDPKHMILAQNVLPLINSKKVNSTVKDVLNKVDAALTTADLIALNSDNQGAQKVSPADAAKKWLADHNLG
ncbi:ABC transporter substrate-binding protein [Diaminobutyricibacter tongyongensis]|uniref:ABC transporter substrate-binding protein n=1 Tax=Leifsonia tongyongensis TaxID=1268043 RepID=A0A6L9XYL3_9MICO|nr:ABC transporter substrate-binding protein [Diaminobutyricibacter tongyongensis]NEN06511.1 ABC transporter substrate-binding protein [Diaminobutyricibacter tongyongensis]